MKYPLTLLLCFALFGVMMAQEGIVFKDLSWNETLNKAREEGTPVFVDCYTTWCGPCKWMAANMFTRPEIGEFYNQNFICVQFDMEKGDGLEIAKEYQVRGYPTLLYLDPSGELLNIQLGAPQDPQPYIEMAKMALDPKRNMQYLQANKDANYSDPAFMVDYFKAFGTAGRLEANELSRYLGQFSLEEWNSDENWQIIVSQVEEVESPIFQELLKNEELFAQKHANADDYFQSVLYYDLRKKYFLGQRANDLSEYEAARAELAQNYPKSDKVLFEMDLLVTEREEDWDRYCELCYNNVKKYYWSDADKLNDIAWTVFEQSDNEKNLEMALVWAERAQELAPNNHYILDTYANLQFVNGQAEEALQTQKKAIKLAEKEGADTESYQALITKIEEYLKS